jgi:dihydrofolate reductase
MIISLIAALDKNRLIGADNGMPWYLPGDFKHFKEVTMGKPIVMGRKTFQSIGKPLPGRKNIVISRSGFKADGVFSADSIEAALKLVEGVEEVMIIGGANIYQQIIGKAERMYITHVDAECEGDAWFPEFDCSEWEKLTQLKIEANDKDNYDYKIVTYQRIK